ncbi:hypothetical protein DFH09DRAFT_1080531 [Mycena vulgaris]|nr:hypothetical protein DFH09DRAFT_1080531 [Mycena vulgaris]
MSLLDVVLSVTDRSIDIDLQASLIDMALHCSSSGQTHYSAPALESRLSSRTSPLLGVVRDSDPDTLICYPVLHSAYAEASFAMPDLPKYDGAHAARPHHLLLQAAPARYRWELAIARRCSRWPPTLTALPFVARHVTFSSGSPPSDDDNDTAQHDHVKTGTLAICTPRRSHFAVRRAAHQRGRSDHGPPASASEHPNPRALSTEHVRISPLCPSAPLPALLLVLVPPVALVLTRRP